MSEPRLVWIMQIMDTSPHRPQLPPPTANSHLEPDTRQHVRGSAGGHQRSRAPRHGVQVTQTSPTRYTRTTQITYSTHGIEITAFVLFSRASEHRVGSGLSLALLCLYYVCWPAATRVYGLGGRERQAWLYRETRRVNCPMPLTSLGRRGGLRAVYAVSVDTSVKVESLSAKTRAETHVQLCRVCCAERARGIVQKSLV